MNINEMTEFDRWEMEIARGVKQMLDNGLRDDMTAFFNLMLNKSPLNEEIASRHTMQYQASLVINDIISVAMYDTQLERINKEE